jgi:hypothetical protein
VRQLLLAEASKSRSGVKPAQWHREAASVAARGKAGVSPFNLCSVRKDADGTLIVGRVKAGYTVTTD